MDLPKLSPGKRFTLPRPPGSADALLLARLAEREKAGQRRTAIVTADASDAQRPKFLHDHLAVLQEAIADHVADGIISEDSVHPTPAGVKLLADAYVGALRDC